MQQIEVVQLTPQQKQQWETTVSLMMWSAPGFTHLFLKLLTNNDSGSYAVFTKSVPVAATDAKNILVNPDTFFNYTLKGRVAILTHEVIHNVYGDVEFINLCRLSGTVPLANGKAMPFDEESMQRAMDYRINALIVDSKIGELPKDGCFDPKIAGPLDGISDVYPKVYKKRKEQNDTGDGGFDVLLPPGQSTGQSPNDPNSGRNQKQWDIEMVTARQLEAMKAQGKMSAAMQSMFKDILEPVVPWQDHILAAFSRRVGSGQWNWRQPDQLAIERDLYMPSRTGKNAGWLVVWGDTSGSIGEDELNSYIAELGGILEQVRPSRLTVCWCDAKIRRIDELYDMADLEDTKFKGAPGRGGTNMHPVLDWIAEQHERPEMFLAFTDGYVDFPAAPPPYPVIWASTTDVQYPFGDVVRIKA